MGQQETNRKAMVLFEMVGEAIPPERRPNISLPADVDLDSLAAALGKADKTSLVFDTRPIGKVGLSRNDRWYGQRAIRNLVAQVNTKRPEGRWGHLADYEFGSKYEMPAVRWLAAEYDETTETAWGKMVALTPEAERHLLSAQALRARVGTSIFGLDPATEGGEVIDYSLVTIDLANAELVGVPAASVIPAVSAETIQTGVENMNVKTETAVTAPPAVVVPEVAEDQASLVESLVALLGNSEDPLSAVKSLQETNKSLQEANRALQTEIQGLLETSISFAVKEAVVLESARPVVLDLVKAEAPKTRAEVATVIQRVLDRESVQTLLKAQFSESMGPVIHTQGSQGIKNGNGHKYVNIPE